MPRVRVRLFAEYYDLAGKRRELVLELPPGTTVLDLARLLEEKLPGLRGRLVRGDKIPEDTKVLVNGRNIEWLRKEKTVLREGDTVAFFPPAAGG